MLLVIAIVFMVHFSNNILLEYDEEVFRLFLRSFALAVNNNNNNNNNNNKYICYKSAKRS